LAHDALAPLIRLRFEQSQAPGPRAAAILENRLRNTKDPIAAPLDSTDLSLVLSGKQGMRAWTVEEEKLVSISKQRRNRTRRLRYLAVGLIATLTISLGYVGWRNYQGLQVQNAELLENEADRISDPTEQLITYYKSLQQHAGTIDRKDKFYTTYRDHLFPSSFITMPLAYGVAFGPDGNDMIILEKEGEGHSALRYRYDATTDSLVLAHEMEKGISADQADLAISANGQFFTSGGEDHRLQAWNMAGSQSFTLEIPGQAIELLAISDNGRWLLAYLSGTSTLLLKDTRNDQDPINISTSNKPSSLIFLDQNRGFVVGSIAGDLTHYNLSGELVEILPVAEDE
ncbi:MAG: WD40 repeat domain-containing protein, partial [Bacteroidota bacterium]